jgi:hypothetical protein
MPGFRLQSSCGCTLRFGRVRPGAKETRGWFARAGSGLVRNGGWRLLQTCREAGQSATAPSCRQALRLVAAIREAFIAAEAERAKTLLVNAMTRFTPAA